ncbi:MAG: NAD-dependent malic enzyme [Deltaproteobacteria bacterium HGW-Deltaproteobacteria-1]|jgi:malate dehydrogenase (oxaloacetate-decarboxylating)(NADP+)|nr:MAG: NAD-dependent malic enzyme [Deltaproteobacteria bacterium HGW-Deltaproteobacteria-1]
MAKHPSGLEELPLGIDLLHDPALNKGTAFTAAERKALGLEGLLPPIISSQQQQVQHIINNVRRKPNNLEKYLYLIGLQDRNEQLFYKTLIEHLEELSPIIYTPTVGLACQEYSRVFRRPRGIFITKHHRGHIRGILRNWPYKDVRIIVVTDGERILGLGDLGSNGVGIPVGKLSLYTACAGIAPNVCLPVMIDVGTGNKGLWSDPEYIGLPEARLQGEEYDALMDEFMEAATKAFPHVMIQLEDFGNQNAFRLLDRYRDRYCIFDDDIQGTASVALAGLYSALRMTGGKMTNQTLLFLGAGEAALGIGSLIVSSMVDQGLSEDEARGRCWFLDSKGLVVESRTDLVQQKRRFAHNFPFHRDLFSAVNAIKPTAIIGASGQSGTFTPEILQAMAKLNERPIVFALSNPTSQSECTAEDAYRHTNSRAVFASGSPFPPVVIDGRTFVPGQANNVYIFPGVGLGVLASKSTRVTDEMFSAAARCVAEKVTREDLEQGRIFPSLSRIREVSLHIAIAVARLVFTRQLTAMKEPSDLPGFIKSKMYDPVYQKDPRADTVV